MAGDNRYSYNEMSNKVEQADRSQIHRRRRGEGTGEVESLRGRTDVGKMGDRVARATTEKNPDFTSRMERARKKKRQKIHDHPGGDTTTSSSSGSNKRQAQANPFGIGSGGPSILEMGDLTGYQPSTDSARTAYENILVRTAETVFSLVCFYVFLFS